MNKQQLASKIWETANNLRSKIKANEYKDYILGFMFYKYLSDNEERYVQSMGGTIEDLKDDSAKGMIQTSIGYFIGYDNLFSVWKNKGNSLGAGTVSEALTEFNRNINPTYKKVFDNIFSTLQGGLSKLGDSSGSRDKAVRDIVDLINDIPTTDNSYDVLGYIYEYLIFKFSTAAKDDGAFYTPHEVSSLIARIVADAMKEKTELNVYDPTSGSGSLLLNIGKEASKYIDSDNIKYFGQEKITETYHLTRMNLIMKGVGVSNIFVRNGDTLEDDWPYFDEETSYEPLMVDAVVSNPPYSLKWEPDIRENDPRFKYGLAPSSKADYAFLLHCLFHLQKDGVMAIVLPHGVLFRGASEGVIRKNLIDNDHIETIIGLPANLFYATGIPTIIMILKKNRTNNDILFIDASQNYTKEKTQNVLRESDIQRIFDAVKNRENIENFCRVVEKSEIIANEYNLNIPRYVSASSEAEKFDLYSVMEGSISDNELSKYDSFWNRFPELKSKLFTRNKGYNTFNNVDIKEIVLNNDKVKAFKESYNVLSSSYRDYMIFTLVKEFAKTSKVTKDEVVAKLFEIFGAEELVDKYSVYQYLADNWDIIENDLITLRENGIAFCRRTEPNMVLKKNSSTNRTSEVQDGWKGTIMPFELVQKLFYGEDFNIMFELQSEIDNIVSEANEIEENLDEEFKEKEGSIKDKRNAFVLEEILRPLSLRKQYCEEQLLHYKDSISKTIFDSVCNKNGTSFNKSKIKKFLKKEENSDLSRVLEYIETQSKEDKVIKELSEILYLPEVPIKILEETLSESTLKFEILSCFEENAEFIQNLNRYVYLNKSKSEKTKELKEFKVKLDDKTKEKVESLTDVEIFNLLVYKWIMPIINGVNATCDSSIDAFVKGLISLKNKYSNNLSEINAEIHKADEELFALMDELVGSETDMLAIQMLKDALK